MTRSERGIYFMSILGYSEDRFESFGSGGYKDWGYELKFGSKTGKFGMFQMEKSESNNNTI